MFCQLFFALVYPGRYEAAAVDMRCMIKKGKYMEVNLEGLDIYYYIISIASFNIDSYCIYIYVAAGVLDDLHVCCSRCVR